MSSTDRIERSVSIDATAAKVWDLIRRPGWWINDGEVLEHAFDEAAEVNVIAHPSYGVFRIRTVSLEPTTYAAFRWLGKEADSPTTLVEFWIEGDQAPVELRVVESGFDSLDLSEAERRKEFEGNSEGWDIEMKAAQAWASNR